MRVEKREGERVRGNERHTESRETLTRKGETKGTDGGAGERELEKAEKWRNVDSGKKERQRDG